MALASLLLLCLLLICFTHCKITLTSPPEYKRIIDYELSTFGLVDYQATVNVEVFSWSSEYGCTAPTDAILQINSTHLKAFIMKRGTCSYRQQAINAHRAGARLVIVYRDDDRDIHDTIPVNPEFGKEFKLPPAVIVSKKDGDLMTKLLSQGKKIVLNVDYELKLFKPTIKVRFVFNPLDLESVKLLKALVLFTNTTSHHIVFKDSKRLIMLNSAPKIYSTLSSEYSEKERKEYCVPGSVYCAPAMSSKLSKASDYVLLSVLYSCMNEVYIEGSYTHLDEYISQIDTLQQELETLEKTNVARVNLVEDLLQGLQKKKNNKYYNKVSDCFTTVVGNRIDEPSFGNQQIEGMVSLSDQQFEKLPALYINELMVRGELSELTGPSALCDSIVFKYRPKFCDDLSKTLSKKVEGTLDVLEGPEEEDKDLSNFKLWLIGMAVSLVLGVLLCIASRFILKGRVESDITREIDDTLSTYYKIRRTDIEIGDIKDVELKPENI